MSKLSGKDVATRMLAIEDNITGETGEDQPPLDRVVAHLLDLEYEDLHEQLVAEAHRTVELFFKWYGKAGVRPTAENIAALGFVQGVTFAAAAMRLRRERRGNGR